MKLPIISIENKGFVIIKVGRNLTQNKEILPKFHPLPPPLSQKMSTYPQKHKHGAKMTERGVSIFHIVVVLCFHIFLTQKNPERFPVISKENFEGKYTNSSLNVCNFIPQSAAIG